MKCNRLGYENRVYSVQKKIPRYLTHWQKGVAGIIDRNTNVVNEDVYKTKDVKMNPPGTSEFTV
jgi:hypothetical protein